MALREIESTLPPGFRFYPSDEELVCHYLLKKVANERIAQGTLVEVDLHAREPWELPEVAKLTASEWYFFSFRDRKYATGSRTNRATRTGYWKATGKDREVRSGGAVVGMRKTLVFYRGRAPNGVKSGWVMHEFRLDTPHSPPREDWVLCRVFQKAKGDAGDGQDGDSVSSPTSLLPGALQDGSSSRVEPPPEPDYHAASPGGGAGGCYGGYTPSLFPPQHEVPAVLPPTPYCYYGGGGGVAAADDRHHYGGFPRDDATGSLPGFGLGGDGYGFGYFDTMGGGFGDVASLGGGVEFPQVWN